MALLRKKAAANKDLDLSSMVKSGDQEKAYEALQLYRSKAMRFKSKGDILGAIKLTADGSKLFLDNNYETAGTVTLTL